MWRSITPSLLVAAHGVMVSVAILLTTRCAPITAVVFMETEVVVTVKVTVVEPLGTVTVPGIDTCVSVVARKTIRPPGPARAVRATVPMELDPPVTDVGESLRLDIMIGGFDMAVMWLPIWPRPSLVVYG